MENPNIYLYPVLNDKSQGDKNRLLDETLHEMKLSLQQWRENMKKVEYFSFDIICIVNPMINHVSINTHTLGSLEADSN